MPSILRLIDRVIGLVCWAGLALSAAVLLTSFGLVVYSVGMRYLLGRPVPWVDEMVGYLLVALVMLAAADAMRRGEHIAVDLITDRLPPAGKTIMTVVALVAVTFCGAVLVIAGLETAAFTQLLGIRSTGYLNVPMHIPQLLIPVGGGLLALAAIGALLRMAIGLQPDVEHDRGPTPPDQAS
jgi:C4-dicarboxylate transporter, DctQ subunit